MKTIIVLALLTAISVSAFAQDAKVILKKSYDKCQSVQNGNYEMTLYEKQDYNSDIMQVQFNGSFKKLKNDSLYGSAFHYKIFFNGKCTGNVLYTGSEFVNMTSWDSTALIMSNKLWAVNILRYNTTLYTPFTDSVSAPIPHGGELIDKSCISRFNGEEIINNIPCYHVQVNKIPVARKEEKIKIIQSEYHYWISKADFVPVQYSTATGLVVDKDTTYNYEKLVLNKYEINNLQDEKFLTLQSIPVNYTTKDYVPGKKINLLAKDSLAPDWELLSVKNKKINLTALRGKLVLVDFFYKGCFPCILTFPALQSLHQKYRAKGLMVIGINPVDRKEDDIPSFLLKHGVTYPVLFSGQEIENDYHISGYPTLYLIDKNGRVIFSHCGYSKDLEKTLEKLIRKNL